MSKKLLTLTPEDLRSLLRDAEEQGHGRSVKQKLQWFLFAAEHKHNISLTCRHFAITRSTFLRWIERFDSTDLSTLDEKSRRPNKVRMPETAPEIISLIRNYREVNKTMGKEMIRKLLQEEHGITISASTVGRVISRNHFFFSDQPAHQIKIRAWTINQEENVQHYSEQSIPLTGEISANDEKKNDASDTNDQSSGGATWFGPGLSILLVLAGLGASVFTGTPSAHAEESASYRIETGSPNEAEATIGTSNSYSVRTETSWYREGAASTSYQIVAELPASSSSSSAASSTSGGTSGGGGSAFGTGGGHHPGVPRPPVTRSSASSSRSSTRAAPGGVHQSAPEQENAMRLRAILRGKKRIRKAAQKAQQLRLINEPAVKFLGHDSPAMRLMNLFRTRDGELHPVRQAASIIGLQSLLPILGSDQSYLWILLSVAIFAAGFFLGKEVELFTLAKPKAKTTGKAKKVRKYRRIKVLAITLVSLALLLLAESAIAAASVPNAFVYKGHLLTSGGTPVTTAHNIRFSFWKSTDAVAGDITGGGAINTGASNYVSWNEVQTVTPDSNGYFSVSLGSSTALPDFSGLPAASLANLHLQVEVKGTTEADTAYEILDVNAADSSIDRSPLLSVPSALNAALVDQRSLGSSAGNIPYLDGSAQLAKAMIPGGTNVNFFTIDADGSTSTGSLTLNFGTGLNKKLTYDIDNSRFNFNSNLRIQGNLTVTGSLVVNGLINGIDITSITTSNLSPLKVSSGAGLNASVSAGNYRVNGDITNYTGASNVSLTNNADNYLFFTSTGLTLSTSGFPVDKSFIPLAKVTTAGGAVTSVTDKRVLQSDDREQSMLWMLHPDFADSAYQADGTDNVGQLSVANDVATGKNYYAWISTRSSLQDYDIVTRITLPQSFNHWNSNPLTINYRTGTGNAAENKLDITVIDTAGNTVSTTGGSSLASTTWTTSAISFSGTPTWTAGGTIIVKIKVSALSSGSVNVGDLELRYSELH